MYRIGRVWRVLCVSAWVDVALGGRSSDNRQVVHRFLSLRVLVLGTGFYVHRHWELGLGFFIYVLSYLREPTDKKQTVAAKNSHPYSLCGFPCERIGRSSHGWGFERGRGEPPHQVKPPPEIP